MLTLWHTQLFVYVLASFDPKQYTLKQKCAVISVNQSFSAEPKCRETQLLFFANENMKKYPQKYEGYIFRMFSTRSRSQTMFAGVGRR